MRTEPDVIGHSKRHHSTPLIVGRNRAFKKRDRLKPLFLIFGKPVAPISGHGDIAAYRKSLKHIADIDTYHLPKQIGNAQPQTQLAEKRSPGIGRGKLRDIQQTLIHNRQRQLRGFSITRLHHDLKRIFGFEFIGRGQCEIEPRIWDQPRAKAQSHTSATGDHWPSVCAAE